MTSCLASSVEFLMHISLITQQKTSATNTLSATKDMVDKKICGELDTNLSVMKDLGCADLNYIETDIYQLMFLPTYLIWDNADNPDFGEQ